MSLFGLHSSLTQHKRPNRALGSLRQRVFELLSCFLQGPFNRLLETYVDHQPELRSVAARHLSKRSQAGHEPRVIMESAAKSNLKNVTLELGGQACCALAGSRIYVHEKIYDEFLSLFTEAAKNLKLGDPFAADTYQGPQVSVGQFNVRSF